MKKLIMFIVLLMIFFSGTILVNAEVVKNEPYGFWVDKPVGWSRVTEGLGGDLAERFMEPGGAAFIEIYLGTNITGGNVDVLVQGWENKTLGNLEYMQQKISVAAVTISGLPGALGIYEGNTQGIPLRTNVAYVVGGGKAFAMVGVLRKDAVPGLENQIQQSLLSLSLNALPPSSNTAVSSATAMPSTQSSVTSSQPAAITETVKPEVSYEIKIPAGWENDKNIPDPDVTLQIIRNKKDRAQMVSVMRGKLDRFTPEELKSLVEMSMESFGQKNPLYEKKISEIDLNIDGGIGLAVVFLGKGNNNKAVKSLVHYISAKNACFIISGTVPMNASDDDWNTLDGMMNSFKVILKN